MAACDQVQRSVFRAVVGKLQYITGLRPDLMFATKCLSYKFASPTLADLTRAKRVLRYLKGTSELNLYLTIPALKPNDLNKTLKHITGYSDDDWAGDPVTRKSTSYTLCYVDQFLLTSECRGQGTVALSSGESDLCALGALSAELIFAQVVLKEIWLSFLTHARADSSTARAVATKQGATRKMKHIHKRFLFIQDLVFRKLLTLSSVKTKMWIRVTSERKRWDVSDSTDWDQCLEWVQSWARQVLLANGTVATTDFASHWIRVWSIGRVERSTHVSKRRIFVFFCATRDASRIWHSLATRGGVFVEPL